MGDKTVELGPLARELPHLCRLMADGYKVRMDESSDVAGACTYIDLTLEHPSGSGLLTSRAQLDGGVLYKMSRRELAELKAKETIKLLHRMEAYAASMTSFSEAAKRATMMGRWDGSEMPGMEPERRAMPTPEELADSDKIADMLYRSFKEGKLPPGFRTSMPGGGKFEVYKSADGRIGTSYTKGYGAAISTHHTAEEEPTTRGFAMTSEKSLGDSKEILCNIARDLAAQLSRDLRHDGDCFRELKQGGKLVRDLEITIAGQRISVTMELEGLGPDPNVMA